MEICRIILGSGSKFRREILSSTGLKFEVATPRVDEAHITAETPWRLALLRAEAKGLAAAKIKENGLVIGADQVLSFDGKPYDKASTRDEARIRLEEFSGHVHTLHSAYSIIYTGKLRDEPKILTSQVVDVKMSMRTLSSSELEAYLDTKEWLGCVGCYQFEHRGVHLFDAVEGDSSSIVGLPLISLLKTLRSFGVNPLVNPCGPWQLTLPSVN